MGVAIYPEHGRNLASLMQKAFLKKHGCDIGQGYYFSKPIPANEVKGLLTKLES